jgi:hypothetical protein
LIPRVAGSEIVYEILVTDRRIILVCASISGLRFRDWWNLMFSGDTAAAGRAVPDLRTADIDSLAGREENESIPIASIRKVEVKGMLGAYKMMLEASTEEGEKLFHFLALQPPKELISAKKAQGVPPKETRRQYALRCQDLVKRVLPPSVSLESRWVE